MRLHPSTVSALVLTITGAACSTDSPTTPAVRTIPFATEKKAALTDGTYTSFDVPGATGTLALDINDKGTIVGRYFVGVLSNTHAFIRTRDGLFTTFDYPGASLTVATSINSHGDIVGQYAPATAPRQRHGFLLKDGVFSSFDPPRSTFTNALGINDRGDIVGRYCTLSVCGPVGSGVYTGFLLRHGQFTDMVFPGSKETDGWKINDRRTIFGGFVSATGEEHTFVLRHGRYSELQLPISNPVSMDNGGQNARGDVVGTYCDAAVPCLIIATGNHGFFRSRKTFETIDYPGAVATALVGINSHRQMVGGWLDTDQRVHAFLLAREKEED